MNPYKPMLAKDADLAKVKFPLLVQDKLDGIRAAVVDGKLLSRTLKEIPNREIFNALSRPEFEGLDGELIVGSPTSAACYRSTASYVMAPNKTGEPWCFYVFDKWNEDAGFEQRHAKASAIVRDAFRLDGDLEMVPYRLAASESDLEAIEVERIEAGHEGVIARIPGSAYKFGRSGKTGPLLKIKRHIDFEAEVIGVYEELHNANEAKRNALGRTERSSAKAGKVGKGTLGGLVLRAINGPCEGVEFRCGTGFNANQRDMLWRGREGIVGLTAKIKAFPIGVKEKPRHPVWQGWRFAADLPSTDSHAS